QRRALGSATAPVAVSGASPETSNVDRCLMRKAVREVRTTTFGVPGGAPGTATGAVALPKARVSSHSRLIFNDCLLAHALPRAPRPLRLQLPARRLATRAPARSRRGAR